LLAVVVFALLKIEFALLLLLKSPLFP
jgi:hypothetical protein